MIVYNKRVKSAKEYKECLWFFEWACLNPLLKEFLIKHVNEGQRTNGDLLKKMGMRPGLPDYQLPIINNNWYGLWIEMKRVDGKNKKKDPNQDEWIEKLNHIKQYATYAYGWVHAAEITTAYLCNKV